MHPNVVEAAVVSAPHPIKGHFPYAFVVLSNDKRLTEELVKEIKCVVRDKIGAIAIPDIIQVFVFSLNFNWNFLLKLGEPKLFLFRNSIQGKLKIPEIKFVGD